jgi:hypothetical protein
MDNLEFEESEIKFIEHLKVYKVFSNLLEGHRW